MLLFLLLIPVTVNVSVLMKTKCYKWVVQIVSVMKIQNMGEITEDRKHFWKIFWRMKNLKDTPCVNGRKSKKEGHHEP